MSIQLALTETELLVGLSNDSSECFTELYNRWVDTLHDFIFRFTKSEKLTDDIVQDTFVAIWRYRKTLEIHSSFKSYLFRVSYNLIIKETKRQIQHPLMDDYVEIANNLSVSEQCVTQSMDFDAFIRDYNEAKKKLTPRQLEIFTMSKEQECSIKEIAERLLIAEQSVKNQLAAATKIIKTDLQKYHYLLWVFLGI